MSLLLDIKICAAVPNKDVGTQLFNEVTIALYKVDDVADFDYFLDYNYSSLPDIAGKDLEKIMRS